MRMINFIHNSRFDSPVLNHSHGAIRAQETPISWAQLILGKVLASRTPNQTLGVETK
jgi:hypothetical protein